MTEQFKTTLIATLRQFPLKRAALFGSFARSEENTNSDIDILIEPEQGFTLFDLLRMERTLQETLHRKIDLVEYSAIKPSIRNKVLAQAITLLWVSVT